MPLSRGLAHLRGLAGDLSLDVVKLPNPVECLPRDLGLCGLPDVVEVAPQVRPTGGLAELAAAIRASLVELAEARVGIRLKDASTALEVPPKATYDRSAASAAQ